MKNIYWNLRDAFLRRVGAASDWLTTLGIFASIVAMFASTFVLVAFTLTQLSMSLGKEPIMKAQTDSILSGLGIEVQLLSGDQYIGLLSSAVGCVAVLVTLWFSVTTTIKYFQQSRDLSRKSLIRKETVRLDGTDDLSIMLRYFKKADSVVVFSGDFSWLTANAELLEHVRRLANERKISFVSYKSQEIVRKAVGELYNDLSGYFRFDDQCKLKCSLVNINQSRVFLYKVDRTLEGGDKCVCIVSSKDDARYLLDTLDILCGRLASTHGSYAG